MFDAVLTGLYAVIAWPAIGYLFLGVFIGLFFGAVPGLSGLVGMAILLPFTFDMAPVSRGLDLIGGDVVEVAPPFDPSGNTALVGANIMFEILCMVAEAVATRRQRRAAE